MMIRTKSPRTRKAALLTAELLLFLPIALVVVLAGVEFALLFLARQQITAASREGARVAAIGGDAVEVENAVKLFLSTGSLAGAKVDSFLTDSNGNPIASGQPIQVVVSIPASQAVPDLLGPFGFSVGNALISAQTIMRKE